MRPGEPFYLVNADVVSDVDLAALGRAHRRLRARHGTRLTLTVFERPPLAPGEIQREGYREIHFDAASGLVTALGEKAVGRPYFVGAAVLEPEALGEVPARGPAEFVPTVLLPAIRDGKAGVHLARGHWHDIGSPGLWLQAHGALLEGLETGAIPGPWRRRIEAVSKRVGERAWISRGVPPWVVRTACWNGPCYWSPLHDSTAAAPGELGPRAVLYGTSQGVAGPFRDGIGFRGLWTGGGTS
jgi:NDP-sugar pyrophosphorylase family protein